MGKIKNNNNNNSNDEDIDKFIEKRQGKDQQNYSSLKTIKNSIKSERTMATTFRTISSTKKAINFD
jgi:hypothetical protein